jgi:hypothetical protein
MRETVLTVFAFLYIGVGLYKGFEKEVYLLFGISFLAIFLYVLIEDLKRGILEKMHSVTRELKN